MSLVQIPGTYGFPVKWFRVEERLEVSEYVEGQSLIAKLSSKDPSLASKGEVAHNCPHEKNRSMLD